MIKSYWFAGFLSLLLAACRVAPGAGHPLEARGTTQPSATPGSIDHSAGAGREEPAYPEATAVLWAEGFLWTANESGLLTRWDVKAGGYRQYRLPGDLVVRSLASDGQAIYAGTEGGGVWRISHDGSQTQVSNGMTGQVTALTFDSNKNLWWADSRRGLVLLAPGQGERIYNLNKENSQGEDSLKRVTALVFDPGRGLLWVGTGSGGVLSYDTCRDTWLSYTTFNSGLGNDEIRALTLAVDGSLSAATSAGVSTYRDGTWESLNLQTDPQGTGLWSLAIAAEGILWATGENYIARAGAQEAWQVYAVADNPLLSDRSRFVIVDEGGYPWFIGRRGKIHFDGHTWTAYDADVRRFAHFTPFQPSAPPVAPPRVFSSPAQDYVAWLKTWPRPAADNGRGMHFLRTHQYDAIEAQRQVNRMQRLGVRWALVPYADHEQLVRTAPIFQAAGITVVWRPFVRPYETYASWAQDVEFLRSRGLAPYMELYNEPSLSQEWDGRQVDREVYLRHLRSAAQQVYDAGGYIGLQFVNPDWLRLTLHAMKAQGMTDIFNRLFFVPHLYGVNHPPDYEEDINGVLGFGDFAEVFKEEIGFVPVMIAGEGGWRLGEAQDNRYPAISEELHRDYHLAVWDWFRSGKLSNGEALPDYFFAFCPWLISDPDDPAAWYDSASGDRRLTIEAVEAMPPPERKFSWDDRTGGHTGR